VSAAEEPTSFATPPGGRRFRARDALVCIGVAALLLVLFEGRSIRRTGEEMDPGLMRSLVLVVGRPAGWLADRLPLADAAHDATAWLSPDDDLGAAPGFEAQTAAGPGRGVPPVAPDAFDPRALGGSPAPRRTLRTLLVTGDSMAMPLDVVLARRLTGGGGVRVIRDPHVGTGISKSVLVDWGKLSAHQASRDEPDAAVVFLGANEGFPMPGPGGRPVACCGAGWAAVYATRARRMMDAYRRRGAARVYWLLLPLPRDPRRVRIARAVNAAVAVAADAYRAQVRVLDLARLFTPGGRYRDAMPVGGRETIVRQADGIHLNERGAELAADAVVRALKPDFRLR
jgi:lysophospholipase L1-like esterase